MHALTVGEFEEVTKRFVIEFLHKEGIAHNPMDRSVGIMNDTWYVDTDTLTRMLAVYFVKLTNSAENVK